MILDRYDNAGASAASVAQPNLYCQLHSRLRADWRNRSLALWKYAISVSRAGKTTSGSRPADSFVSGFAVIARSRPAASVSR
jgi:hypothetical protein